MLSELWNLEFLRVAPKEVGGRGKGGALGHKMGVASANRDRAESNNSQMVQLDLFPKTSGTVPRRALI